MYHPALTLLLVSASHAAVWHTGAGSHAARDLWCTCCYWLSIHLLVLAESRCKISHTIAPNLMLHSHCLLLPLQGCPQDSSCETVKTMHVNAVDECADKLTAWGTNDIHTLVPDDGTTVVVSSNCLLTRRLLSNPALGARLAQVIARSLLSGLCGSLVFYRHSSCIRVRVRGQSLGLGLVLEVSVRIWVRGSVSL